LESEEHANLRGEVAGHVNGTSGGKLGEASDVNESRVVGDLEGSTDGLQDRDGNVGQVVVGDKGKISSDTGKVWCVDILHVATVETHGTVDGNEGWDADGRDVSHGHVEGPDQVGELNGKVGAVGVQGGGDVANLGADQSEVGVVVDVQGLDGVQVNTVEGVQRSIGDDDGGSLLDTWGTESKTLESIESGPFDVLDRGQEWEGEV
jgi:hypothetical protein